MCQQTVVQCDCFWPADKGDPVGEGQSAQGRTGVDKDDANSDPLEGRYVFCDRQDFRPTVYCDDVIVSGTKAPKMFSGKPHKGSKEGLPVCEPVLTHVRDICDKCRYTWLEVARDEEEFDDIQEVEDKIGSPQLCNNWAWRQYLKRKREEKEEEDRNGGRDGSPDVFVAKAKPRRRKQKRGLTPQSYSGSLPEQAENGNGTSHHPQHIVSPPTALPSVMPSIPAPVGHMSQQQPLQGFSGMCSDATGLLTPLRTPNWGLTGQWGVPAGPQPPNPSWMGLKTPSPGEEGQMNGQMNGQMSRATAPPVQHPSQAGPSFLPNGAPPQQDLQMANGFPTRPQSFPAQRLMPMPLYGPNQPGMAYTNGNQQSSQPLWPVMTQPGPAQWPVNGINENMDRTPNGLPNGMPSRMPIMVPNGMRNGVPNEIWNGMLDGTPNEVINGPSSQAPLDPMQAMMLAATDMPNNSQPLWKNDDGTSNGLPLMMAGNDNSPQTTTTPGSDLGPHPPSATPSQGFVNPEPMLSSGQGDDMDLTTLLALELEAGMLFNNSLV